MQANCRCPPASRHWPQGRYNAQAVIRSVELIVQRDAHDVVGEASVRRDGTISRETEGPDRGAHKRHRGVERSEV